jgi:hypothetical protein
MPALTRTACKTRARFQLCEPSARFFTESAMNSWCDDAVRDISLRSFCYQITATAIDTVSGTMSYDFPIKYDTSDISVIGVKTILDSSNVSLAYISQDLIGKAGEDSNELKWTDWGRQVLITPTPKSVFKLTMLVWAEATQTAAGDITLPSVYHHLVPLYMTYMGHEAKRNFVLAEKVAKIYEDELMRILQILHGRDNPSTLMKPGTPVQTVSS